MSVSGQIICELAERAAEAPGPDDALRTLTELRAELDEFERQQVARALTAGETFGDVARAMGISRQATHRRFRDLAPPRSGRRGVAPTPEVRLAVEYARAEAADVGAPELRPEHVVLGILRAGDGRAATALTATGVELEDARRQVRALAGRSPERDGLVRPPRDGQVDIRRVLAEAVRCAGRRGATRIEVEDLLRAALGEPEGSAARVLESLGVAPAGVLGELDAPPDPGSCIDR
jgi:transposase-like protein